MNRIMILAATAAAAICVWLGRCISAQTTPPPRRLPKPWSKSKRPKTSRGRRLSTLMPPVKTGREPGKRQRLLKMLTRHLGCTGTHRFDKNGQVGVTITDLIHQRELTYSIRNKRATSPKEMASGDTIRVGRSKGSRRN